MRRLVALALVGAAVVPAQAQSLDGRTIECGSSATYFPWGTLWAVTPSTENAGEPEPVWYRQYTGGSDDIAGDYAQKAVYRAFLTWMNAQCSGAYPNILVMDQFDATGEDYPTPDRGDVYQGDALVAWENIVYWIEEPADWQPFASDVLAVTTQLPLATGFVITADIEVNGAHFGWRTVDDGGNPVGCSVSTTTQQDSNCYDIETTVLHEIGHFLGFNHVQCTDAVMNPHSTPASERHTLSNHEKAGLCALYPPRSAAQKLVAGEQCASTSECDTGLVCIKHPDLPADNPYGYCAETCSTTSDCGAAFVCAQLGTTQFCMPGLRSSSSTDPGYTDPGTGRPSDFCDPCTSGSQCSSGICVGDGTNPTMCTQGCAPGSASGCPNGFSCVATNQNWSVCWPDNPLSCGGEDNRAGINDVCFQESVTGGDHYFRSCGPDLVCFGFRPRCGGQTGACVTYCNSAERPYGGETCPDPNQQCCFGVDNDGQCLAASVDRQHGGCFSRRKVGESCVSAENSICEPGAGCYFFSNPSVAKCYRECTSKSDCSGSETCEAFADGCGNQFGLCCANGNRNDCLPGAPVEKLDVGVACRENADCNSGLCLRFEGRSACTRRCNPVTDSGCPGDEDMNGDGITDGGFTCRLISEAGYCWPNNGPISPPANSIVGGDASDGGGCCSAVGVRREPGDALLGLLLWLPVLVQRWRRRRV